MTWKELCQDFIGYLKDDPPVINKLDFHSFFPYFAAMGHEDAQIQPPQRSITTPWYKRMVTEVKGKHQFICFVAISLLIVCGSLQWLTSKNEYGWQREALNVGQAVSIFILILDLIAVASNWSERQSLSLVLVIQYFKIWNIVTFI